MDNQGNISPYTATMNPNGNYVIKDANGVAIYTHGTLNANSITTSKMTISNVDLGDKIGVQEAAVVVVLEDGSTKVYRIADPIDMVMNKWSVGDSDHCYQFKIVGNDIEIEGYGVTGE